MCLVAYLLFSAPSSVIPFHFVLSHSYIFSFNSISPSIINKGFTFSLLNTDEEHQKALKDLEVARGNLQVFFTVLWCFYHIIKHTVSGITMVHKMSFCFSACNVKHSMSWTLIFLGISLVLYFYNLSFSIFWCISFFLWVPMFVLIEGVC